MAIACNRGIDQAWIDLVDCLIVHAIFFQGSWKVILHENIAFGCQLMKDPDTCRMLEREAERFLVPIDLLRGKPGSVFGVTSL